MHSCAYCVGLRRLPQSDSRRSRRFAERMCRTSAFVGRLGGDVTPERVHDKLDCRTRTNTGRARREISDDVSAVVIPSTRSWNSVVGFLRDWEALERLALRSGAGLVGAADQGRLGCAQRA